jgi:signal transduction histidine kinase
VSLCAVTAGAAEPTEALDRTWLITSLLNGSQLANLNIFDIGFEKEPSPSGVKAIWVASSDGLHRFDGFRWQRYGKANGLPSNFVRCVLVTRSGQLWVGTSEGAGVFDGNSFSRHGSENGLAGPSVRRIVEDKDGTLWFCSDTWPTAAGKGGLASFRDGRWRSWRLPDGLPSDYVVNFFRNSEGRQFAVTSEGLAELKGSHWTFPLRQLARPGLNWGSGSIAESPRFGTVVSTGTDVFVLKNGEWSAFPRTLRHEHGIISTSDGSILACGSLGPNDKAFFEWTGDRWKRISAAFSTTHDYVENLAEGPDGSIYAVGFDCLRRWERRGSDWHAYPGIPKPQITDSTGAVWFMDERGFYVRKENRWQQPGQPYAALLSSPAGIWGWNARALTLWKKSDVRARIDFQSSITEYEIVSIDRQGKVWAFGRDRSNRRRLLRLDGNRWTEITIPEVIWAKGAADPTGGMWYLAHEKDGQTKLLKVGDGYTAYPVPPALVSQYANSIYADHRGNVWLLGETGLHRWNEEHSSSWETISGLPGSSVIGCLEQGGILWFAVDGALGGRSGLASLFRSSWRIYDTDPISSWSLTEDGQVLFGSKGKFYVIPANGDRLPLTVRLPEPEPVIGIVKDRNQTYWIGTPQGTLLFQPSLIAPDTDLISYNDRILEGDRYRTRARGRQRFRPGAPAANFSYSWRIDQAPWTLFDARAERSFSTRGLTLGIHHLQVRSRDNNMNIDPTPAEITFRVHQLALQERRWFLPAVICLAVLLTGLSILATSARFKLARQAELLEQMVEARTTELKLREQELRESNRALRRTNEDLRQFSWAASHDLQEPLRMVVTYTQFLAKRYRGKLDATGDEFIGYAVDGARRVQALLQALLEYWQVSEATPETQSPIDLSVTLRKAVGNLDLLIRETGAVITSSGLPRLEVSEAAFVQLFQNLVSNAIKYRKPGVTPRVNITARQASDSEWLFSIEDNGVGIAPEHHDHIFKLFKRLNGNRNPGTGIGLALCAKIVENFEGKLWVDSELGRGSTFHFTVPERKA